MGPLGAVSRAAARSGTVSGTSASPFNYRICHTRTIHYDPRTISGPRYKQPPEPHTMARTTSLEPRAIAADAAKRELSMPDSTPDDIETRRGPRVYLERQIMDGGAPSAKGNGRVEFSRCFEVMGKIGRAGPDMALRTEIGAEPRRRDSSLNRRIFGGASNHRAAPTRIGVGRRGARRRTRYAPCPSSRPSALPPGRPRPRYRNVARVRVELPDRRSAPARERKTSECRPQSSVSVERCLAKGRKTPLARSGGA